LLLGCLSVLASLFFVGCSERGSAEQLDSPVAITMKNTIISIENRAGQPLTGVTLTVVPFGQNGYSKSLANLNTAERRDVGIGELANAEGVRFNPVLTRPKLVRLTATDAVGKQYDVELPWR
jgi:hypothetical protein